MSRKNRDKEWLRDRRRIDKLESTVRAHDSRISANTIKHNAFDETLNFVSKSQAKLCKTTEQLKEDNRLKEREVMSRLTTIANEVAENTSRAERGLKQAEENGKAHKTLSEIVDKRLTDIDSNVSNVPQSVADLLAAAEGLRATVSLGEQLVQYVRGHRVFLGLVGLVGGGGGVLFQILGDS